ncbi:MAG: hypothetical protein M3P48_11660, partial [Actinomycetota bacterium]|nr:hypothetical protein [Actinomycetota bacterium]
EGVLLWNRGEPAGQWWTVDRGAVPAVQLRAGWGRALVRATARGAVRVALAGHLHSPAVYDVAESEQGKVPATLSYTYRRTDLARVSQLFGSHGVAGTGTSARFPAAAAGITAGQPFALGSRRVDWVNTDTSWVELVETGRVPPTEGAEEDGAVGVWIERPTAYAARRSYRKRWLQQMTRPAEPRNATAAFPARAGDAVTGYVSAWTDRSGRASVPSAPDRYRLSLSADGAEIFTSTEPAIDVVLPAEPRTYVLALRASKRAGAWRRSTRTHTRWTFTSGHVSGAARRLPLLSVNAALPLAVDNTTRAGTLRFELAVRRPGHSPARVDRASVEVSFDSGRTWRRATVRRVGPARFSVAVAHGDHRGPVALRVTAADRLARAAIEQTVLSAYVVR